MPGIVERPEPSCRWTVRCMSSFRNWQNDANGGVGRCPVIVVKNSGHRGMVVDVGSRP